MDKFNVPKGLLDYPEHLKPIQFTAIAELRANEPKFAEFYFENRVDPTTQKSRSIFKLIEMYNEEVKPDVPFWPKVEPARVLNRKLKKQFEERLTALEKEGKQVIRPLPPFGGRNQRSKLKVEVVDRTLEERTETLADRLIDSATQELDLAGDDDPNVGLKRKAHALGVFAYVSRHVHKKKDIAIKQSAAKVGEASFMMNLLGQASSGKLTAEQLAQLESAITPVDESDHAEDDENGEGAE